MKLSAAKFPKLDQHGAVVKYSLSAPLFAQTPVLMSSKYCLLVAVWIWDFLNPTQKIDEGQSFYPTQVQYGCWGWNFSEYDLIRVMSAEISLFLNWVELSLLENEETGTWYKNLYFFVICTNMTITQPKLRKVPLTCTVECRRKCKERGKIKSRS